MNTPNVIVSIDDVLADPKPGDVIRTDAGEIYMCQYAMTDFEDGFLLWVPAVGLIGKFVRTEDMARSVDSELVHRENE